MGPRYEVEVTLTSAKHLKNVNWRHGKLRPYAVVWVDTNNTNKCSTRVDEDCDDSPRWGEKLLIPFDSPIEDSTLYVDVVHADAAEGTKPLIGSARLRLRDVIDDVGLGGAAERKLELKRPSGRPHGKLEVRVSVREPPRYPAPDPYRAPPYGVPPPDTRDYYPAPPYGTPYGGPPSYSAPPAGYPPTPTYGHPPPPIYGQPAYGQGGYSGQQGYAGEQKKSQFGGMGTGLAVGAVAGVLGGLAVAEGVDALEDKIADDAADRVEDDLGYDEDDY